MSSLDPKISLLPQVRKYQQYTKPLDWCQQVCLFSLYSSFEESKLVTYKSLQWTRKRNQSWGQRTCLFFAPKISAQVADQTLIAPNPNQRSRKKLKDLLQDMEATTPKISKTNTPSRKSPPFSTTSHLTPKTPQPSDPPRRSSRPLSLKFEPEFVSGLDEKPTRCSSKGRGKQGKHLDFAVVRGIVKDGNASGRTPKTRKGKGGEVAFSPVQIETRKRKRGSHGKKRVYYRKVEYDGAEFEVGNDVYVKRREDNSDEEPEMEECKVCFKTGKAVMIECDDCLGGFHLKCLKPPLKEVPEGDWVCGFCEARKQGKEVEFPTPLEGKRARTLRERLLAGDLFAARIESLWKEVDGTYWFRGRWYIIPEETAAGRQPHNLKRELYQTNDFDDAEMECIIRHCYVMSPKEYAKAIHEGDDVFFCEYEYDIHWHSFKRLAEMDEGEGDNDAESDEDWKSPKNADSDTDDELEYEEENLKSSQKTHPVQEFPANTKKGQCFGLQKIGTKNIPNHVRCHKQTELEKAKAMLLLSTLPKSTPCRNTEMEEITTFIKGAICDDQCLGRCLYIHGVPGTGKTMTVLAAMRSLKTEVDTGGVKPYCFVEINGLKLASPENIYRVIYEVLTGNRVSWKKALRFLNERFSDGKKIGREDDRPCILLIDELDLLVTRNQSVLYNILDWPTKPHSKLIVLGIANTMDLPEKLLPRISSRMGIQRLCFGPYNYQQLQEIVSSRLKGIDAFEKQAIEFASRKVAAISGDARRALEICRRAAEIADYRVKRPSSSATPTSVGIVGMSEVEAAIQEMFQAPHIQIMRACSRLSKIFLTAMVYELYKTGMSETTFEKLSTTVSALCSGNKEAFPGWDTLLKVGCRLGESRIIICEAGANHRMQKLQLNFPSDDVAFALKDCKELPWLAKYL